MQKITITGNLTGDVEIRYTDDGKAIAKFSVAVNTREQNVDREWVDVSYFYRVTTMPRSDSQREYIERNATKGARALVSGTPKFGAYLPKDGGDPRVSMDVAFPDVLEFFPRSNGHREPDEAEGKPAQTRKPAAAGSSRTSSGNSSRKSQVNESTELDDLPF